MIIVLKILNDIEDSLQTHPQKYTEWFKIALPQIKLFHKENLINCNSILNLF